MRRWLFVCFVCFGVMTVEASRCRGLLVDEVR